ncbi:MAG: RagB/SusD family nutrient uptake outer membrane protein [Bacteroidales bacterium]|nr:RagB/SusD family nutrient uptake outer membrane protein [Bacteroidales bacterium]
MKYKNILAAALCLPLLSSCLEKTPSDYLPIGEGMNSVTAATQLVNGMYNTLKGKALYSGYLTLCPDIQADLVHAVQGNSNTFVNLWQWNILSGDSNVEAVYAGLYSVIGQCNYYLENVDALKNSLTDDDLIIELDALTGETYTCRALCYSELIKLFCKAYDPATAEDELGVVLATSYSGPKPSKRASLAESYKLVLEDLARADKLLDPDDNAYNTVYFKNAAVHALWARVALYMQDWDAAIEHSSKVIDEGPFELADANRKYTSTQSYLQYLWADDASLEIIFKLGYTQTSYGYPTGAVFLNFTRDYTYYYPDFVPSQWALDLYQNADCRYDCYFRTLQTGYSHSLSCPLLVKYYGNEGLLQLNIFHVNMPKPLRLAEQYLIRAEAYCNKKLYSKASADLSTLRKSRFSTGGTLSVGEDNWLDTISDERVRELYMEGFRLHDLKRWHRGFERKSQTSCVAEGGTLKISADDPLFVWPIPRNELEAPGSEIQPNESNR